MTITPEEEPLAGPDLGPTGPTEPDEMEVLKAHYDYDEATGTFIIPELDEE